MKIKYYLRGLGTGILFATIILTISYVTRNDKDDNETQTTTSSGAESTYDTAQDTTQNSSQDSSKVLVTIESGMSSEQVAEMLQKNRVVQSWADFDSYLKKNGYSEMIAVGNFEINANSTYEEIAEIITNTN